MKILHITPFFEPAWHLGGVVHSISHLCRGLVQQGHEVTVFSTDSGGNRRLPVPNNQPVDVGGIKVYYFKTDFSFKYCYSRDLREACHRLMKDFEIVHLTSFWCYPGIPAANNARKKGIPYVLSVKGTLRKSALRQKAIKKWIYFQTIERRIIRHAAAIHYTTQMEKELDALHKFKNPSFIVPNGFDISEFSSSKNDFKNNLENDKILITFLGRLHKVKKLDLLIKAISTEALKDKIFVLMLAGPDGGEERYLRQLAISLGVDRKIRFLGMIDAKERNNLLAASNLLVLTSEDENFGNAAVEAMLSGVPVLVSDHVGICREILADGAGVVVPIEVEAVAGALVKLLSDPEGLRVMGEAAVESARRRYDIDLVARQMATAYEDILVGRRSPGLSWSDE